MGERGHLESQGGVVCWHSECSLAKLEQLAGAEHRLVQLGVGNHSQEEEERAQPIQLCVAWNADSFCAALEKFSFGRNVRQTVGKSNLWERGEVWGAEEQRLGEHMMVEVSLERLKEA